MTTKFVLQRGTREIPISTRKHIVVKDEPLEDGVCIASGNPTVGVFDTWEEGYDELIKHPTVFEVSDDEDMIKVVEYALAELKSEDDRITSEIWNTNDLPDFLCYKGSIFRKQRIYMDDDNFEDRYDEVFENELSGFEKINLKWLGLSFD